MRSSRVISATKETNREEVEGSAIEEVWRTTSIADGA